jgi:putative flippase GtrA
MHTDIAPTTRQSGRKLPVHSSFVKFVIVGALAYVINQAGLFLLYDVLPLLPAKETSVDFGIFSEPDISLLIASAIAVELSIAFKYFALQGWAFPDRARRGNQLTRFLRFNASCFGSTLVIVGAINVLTPAFDMSPYVATTLGTVLGFGTNWAFSHYLIWPHHPDRAAEAASG